jgi:hypothetical protein
MGYANKIKHAKELVDEYGLHFIRIQETQMEEIKDV